MRTFWDTEMYRGILMVFLAVLSIAAVLSGCSRAGSSSQDAGNTGNLSSGSGAADTVPSDTAEDQPLDGEAAYTLETKVMDVINDPVFGGCGRLIFPADMSIDEELELQDVEDILIWYNNVNPDRTVEIVNYLRDQASSGRQIFYDIYTDAEIEVFDGLRHGFGLGEGTVAEGWIDHAVSFWERNMED